MGARMCWWRRWLAGSSPSFCPPAALIVLAVESAEGVSAALSPQGSTEMRDGASPGGGMWLFLDVAVLSFPSLHLYDIFSSLNALVLKLSMCIEITLVFIKNADSWPFPQT